MLLYAMLALCALVTAVIVYRYDLYDREPWWILLITVLVGAASMWLAGLAQTFVMKALGQYAAANWDFTMALAAGTTEEFAKFLTVCAIALVFRPWFNDPLDGLIYGAFAGLGAAVEESFGVLRDAQASGTLPPHEPIRLAGHLVMGGIGAFGLGMVLFCKGRFTRLMLPATCLAAAVVLHTSWDLIAFRAQALGRMTPGLTAAGICFMLCGLLTFRWLAAIGAARSRAVFAPLAPPGEI